jgi:hypothetical protein
MPRPKDIPLEQWSQGWLKMECASILREREPCYLLLHDHEKREKKLPVTDDEMRALIAAYRVEHQ